MISKHVFHEPLVGGDDVDSDLVLPVHVFRELLEQIAGQHVHDGLLGLTAKLVPLQYQLKATCFKGFVEIFLEQSAVHDFSSWG